MNPVRDDSATTLCQVCGVAFEPRGRQLHCSTTCRQRAWRRRRTAPVQRLVTGADTVYACPACDARYLGAQRCEDCNTFARRLGPGGLCPCCDEPVAVSDLFADDQLTNPTIPAPRRR